MNSAHQVVAAYWAAAEARDWTRFGDLVAEHAIQSLPASGARPSGSSSPWRLTARG
jgi:hypothetical protein